MCACTSVIWSLSRRSNTYSPSTPKLRPRAKSIADTHHSLAQLTPTDAAALVTLEKRLDYDRIVLFRSLAEAYLEKEKQFKEREKQKRIESEKATGAASSEYGNGIWKWWTGAAADTTPTPDLELTDAVWKELFAAVNDEYLTVSSSSDQARTLLPVL